MKPTAHRVAATMALAAVLLAACGGGHDDSAAQPGADAPTDVAADVGAGFTLSVAPASLSVGAGQEAWLEITIRRDPGFDQPVRVQLDRPDAGIAGDAIVIPAAADRATLSIRLTADAAPDSVHALSVTGASASASHVAASRLTVQAPLATSQELIAAARAAGTLTEGAAFLYRAYALLGDRRLPDPYLGAGSTEEDNGLFIQIARRLVSLPAADQAALLPFIVRPADPRSVWNSSATPGAARARVEGAARPTTAPTTCAAAAASGAWISKRSAANPVRVWAQCPGTVAGNATSQAIIDSTLAMVDKIYAPMTALMGPPQLDQNGGDDAIDFYLVDDGAYVWRRGVAWRPIGLGATYDDAAATVVGNGRGNSAFVALPRSVAFGPRFHNTVIHEFFHVLQKAHNADFASNANGEIHWFFEASAAWASAHFDRTEAPWPDGRGAYVDAHRRFKSYFLPSFDALNASGSPHDYSAYIWPFFVEQETGSAAFMGAAWRAIENATTFAQADLAIDGVFSFATNFKTFALRNLNSEFLPGDPLSRARRYVSLDPDQFADDNKVAPPVPEKPLIAGRDVVEPLTLKNASARYLRLTVDGAATPVISKVVVDASALASQAGLDIQALVLTSAGWLAQPIDIGADGATFCFDNGPTTAAVRGSFSQLLLIVSNHAIARGADISGALKVQPSATPCATVWEGSVDEVAQFDETHTGGSFHRTINSTAHLSFELDPNAADLRHVFRLRTGDFSYRETIDRVDLGNTCHGVLTASGPLHRQNGPVDTSDGAAEGTLYTYESPADPLPQYALTDSSESFYAYTTATRVDHCTLDGDRTTVSAGFVMQLWQTHALHDITDDGTTIRGRYAYDNGGGGTTTYTYLFRKAQR